jgi:hypothetical protein
MTSNSPRTASIATDTGRLDLPAGFHHPDHVVWTAEGREAERFGTPSPVLGTGLGNEAAHVQDCLRDGLTDSDLVPRAQTLELLGVSDRIRRSIGVRYDADEAGDRPSG